jgi:lysophospholipase L1-like esterase
MAANTDAFLDVVRSGHPETPIVVATPVVRPDAEQTQNSLGATLAALRDAMHEVVSARIDAGDGRLHLVDGAPLLTAEHLEDGIHPGDEGHRILADAFGAAVVDALEVRS